MLVRGSLFDYSKGAISWGFKLIMWDKRGEKRKQQLANSCAKVPWLTFLFRQNARAQGEERGENDPDLKLFFHCTFKVLRSSTMDKNVSFHANKTWYSTILKLKPWVVVKDFSFLETQTLTAPPSLSRIILNSTRRSCESRRNHWIFWRHQKGG